MEEDRLVAGKRAGSLQLQVCTLEMDVCFYMKSLSGRSV